MNSGNSNKDDEKRSRTGEAYPEQSGASRDDSAGRNKDKDPKAVLGEINERADKSSEKNENQK